MITSKIASVRGSAKNIRYYRLYAFFEVMNWANCRPWISSFSSASVIFSVILVQRKTPAMKAYIRATSTKGFSNLYTLYLDHTLGTS